MSQKSACFVKHDLHVLNIDISIEYILEVLGQLEP